MDTLKLLNTFAEQVPSRDPQMTDTQYWGTKARGDYITHVGMEDQLSYLTKFGITEHISSTWAAGKPINIGFNPDEQKWYGWSHRALYGFGVGSEVKRGDCSYVPTDKDDFLIDMIRFWSADDKLNIHGEHKDDGVYIEWEYDHSIPNEKMRGQITGSHQAYPDDYGKGEWKAMTLADARQMAIDFAEGVA